MQVSCKSKSQTLTQWK